MPPGAATDPRPGEAKLAGGSRNCRAGRRAAAGIRWASCCKRLPVPWTLLAACLPALLASRERREPTSTRRSRRWSRSPKASPAIAATLFGGDTPAPAAGAIVGLLAEQLLLLGDAAVPLQMRARLGDAASEHAAARAWAGELLQRWPPPHDGARAGRIHAALLRERLRRFAARPATRWRPLSRWRVPVDRVARRARLKPHARARTGCSRAHGACSAAGRYNGRLFS